MSFVPGTDLGRLVLNWVNVFLLIATVAAVGRTTLSFVIVVVLAAPAVWLQYIALRQDDALMLAESWMFSGALYFITTAYLLRYVFQPRVMTQDKLFGAAAAYLMLGVMWAYCVRDRRVLLSEFVPRWWGNPASSTTPRRSISA